MTLTTSSVIIDGVEGDKVSPQQSIQSFITMIASAPASALIAICEALNVVDKHIAYYFLDLSSENMAKIVRLLAIRTAKAPALGIQFEISALSAEKLIVTVNVADIATGLRKSSFSYKLLKLGKDGKPSQAQIERFRTFYNELKEAITTQVQFLDEFGLLDRTK